MRIGPFAFLLALLAAVLAAPQPLEAGSKVYRLAESAQVRDLAVVVHTTNVLMFDETIGSYAVGDPEIADVLPIRGKEAYIQGKRLGITNLTVMSADGVRRAVFNIEVTLDTRAIAKMIRRIEPSADISISTSNGRVILTGNVPDAPSAARIMEIVSQFVEPVKQGINADDGPTVINAMTIDQAQQIMLEVRFLEVNRSLGKELGVEWLARGPNGIVKSGYPRNIQERETTGMNSGSRVVDFVKLIGASSFGTALANFAIGSVDVDVAIRALEAKGVTRRLAEPNLVALSGQQATFLAGGQIPYAVPQENGTNTTEFKDYGVRLTFTPTLLRDGIINLKLSPEFSEPDYTSTGENGEPVILTRRAETMVELREGQSFVIAGLLEGIHSRNADQMPILGDVPVLGTLFRSADYRKRESELVIVVTPRIVKPMVPGAPVTTPLETMTSSSDSELFLNGELEKKPPRKQRPQKKGGGTGHILDIGG